jgi:hypothetical protein
VASRNFWTCIRKKQTKSRESASVLDLSDHASDEAFALFLRTGRCRRNFAAFFKRGENLLDFVVNREAAGTGFREDQPSLDDNIELARLACFDFGLFTESGI